MAEEGKRFSERSSRLADFSTRLQGNGGSTTGGSGTQQTQQTQQTGIGNTSGTQSSGGIFLPGITDNAELQSMNKLPKTGFQGAIEQGKVQGNVVLPGITGKTATTISHIDPHEAIEGMQRFKEQEEDRTTGQYRPLVKRGAEHLKGQYQKRAQANLSKSAILERLANIGMANGASKEAMTPYVEEHKEKTLKYNKQINDAFSDWEKRNMDMDLLKQYEGETISGLFSRGDGKGATYKIIKGLSENMNMIPEMIVAMVAPQVGLPMIGTDVYIQESQGTFEELMENGATYEQAQNGAVIVGMANATIEMILERLLGGVQRAGASTLRRLFLKNMQKEAVRNIAKKGFAEILSRGLWNQARSSGVEGLEEILQQWVTNAFVKMVNPDRKLGEGTFESFDQAFWQSLFMPLGGGSESIIRDVQTNKEVDARTDLEALKYVAEGEERKAQRLQQAKQRMKQRFLNPTMDNGYTPSEEQVEQRANEREENEEFEDEMKRENQEGPNYTEEDEQRFTREGIEEQQQADELRSRQNEEVTLENEMAKEALSENINEDLGDPRYQKIDEDLQDIKDSLEKMDDNTFFNRIMSSINKGNKNYVVTTDKNGNKSVLRVVERGGNGKGFNGKTVTVQVMQPSKKSGNVSVNEFTYTPGNLTTDQKQGIITGFENWGKTGNFRDNTAGNQKYQLKYESKGYTPGVAGKNEKSISGKEGIKQKNKINNETIEQLANKYGVKVEVIQGLIKILQGGKWTGKYAYGKYVNQVLTLSEQIKESTAPHELLHAIFDMIDPETKAYLISQVMKSEGWSAKQAEEWLADTFSNFFRTGKIEGAPKSTWGKIKIFFKRVRSFINGLGKWRSELEEIFTDIITSEGIEDLQGKIDQNQKLAEGKARMKKRFMEYAKNAKKVEKNSKSEEKYQEAGDINSKAFKKRFGDSKVVDENGNPLVVYHGTEMKFTKFGRGNGEHGKGFYFTEDRDYAEEFSGKDGNIMEVYLKMDKPLRESVDMNSPEMKKFIKGIKEKWGLSEKEIKDCFVNEDWSSELSSKVAKKMGYGKKDVEKTVGWEFEDIDEIGETDYNAYLGAYAWENGLNDLARESGFDGIISRVYNSDAEGLEYIAFKPNQIKSATDNVGTYDPNNDDIRYQTVDGSEREVKAQVIQDPVKGKMYHVTTEEFENFRESDQYDDEERWDRNDSYGTYVTDAQQFFEDFTKTSPRDNGSGWKKWEIDVDLKKPVLHPYRTWKEFGIKKTDEMIIDWMILVDRFTPEMQKELVAMKMQDYDYENFDYDEYPYKDSYTKEEILALPGSISSAILDAQFEGEGEEIINYLWGDHASEDRETLKKKGYDAIMIYEGEKDGAIFSYALFYPNKFSKKKTEARYQEAEENGMIALQKIADGAEYVRNAMKRDDLKQYGGETGISFYWGEPGKADKDYKGGYGISHIAEKHGAKTLLKMIEVIARGDINKYVKSHNRVSIGYDGYTAILSLSKDFDKETWLVTGWKDNEKKTDGSSEVSTQSTPTQISPTFSRTDLGAVLLKDSITKNDKKANKNAEKYQEADDIDPEAKSVFDLVKNVSEEPYGETYVFDKFVSEKAKNKALNSVPKEWLIDGKAPALMHTNKYNNKPFYSFKNVKDSKYKRYGDDIVVAFFTDNFLMSRSYADQKSIIPKTKRRNISDEELKKELKKMSEENSTKGNKSLFGGMESDKEVKYSVKKNRDGSVSLISKMKFLQHYSYERFIKDYTTENNLEKMGITYSDVFKDPNKIIDFLIENVNRAFAGKDAYVKASRENDGVLVEIFDRSIRDTYPSIEELKDNIVFDPQDSAFYSYVGYGQNIKNLLVVDDFKGEYWSSLGTLSDLFNKKKIHYDGAVWSFISDVKNAMDGLQYRIEAINERWKDSKYVNDAYGDETMLIGKIVGYPKEGVISMMDYIDEVLKGEDLTEKQKNLLDEYVTGDLTTWGETFRECLEELKKFLSRNYNKFRRLDRNGVKDWLHSIGANDGEIAVLENHYNTNWSLMKVARDREWENEMARELNPHFTLETNDWVRYAIAEGYDAVKFDQIRDYGGSATFNYPGNIYVTLRKLQFKTWDNADPTESNDVRYQTVYHGSQAEFDKFDSSHMGEGEGAQAHGWGHYVAVEERTGRHYAEIGKFKNSWEYDGERIKWSDVSPRQTAINLFLSQMKFNADRNGETDPKKVLQYLIDDREYVLNRERIIKDNLIKTNKEYGKDVNDTTKIDKNIQRYENELKELKKLDPNKIKGNEAKRHFYEVEIPDPAVADTPTGWNYLEEKDRPNKYILNRFIKLAEERGLKEPYGTEDLIKQEGGLKQAFEYEMNHYTTDSFGEIYNVLADYLGGKDNNKDKEASKFLESLGYKGIHYYGGRDGEAYVIFNDDDLEITNHEKYQIAEYDYDENGNRKWLKFGEENEFDPKIFGEPSKQDQIEEDMEKEKGNAFYDSWKKFNIQRYKDDQLTMDEFLEGVATWINKKQDEYDQKMRDLSEAQTDPKMLDLQLRAVKLMEEEGQVGKKFGKNVSKEVRVRQQAEVEKKREQLIKDIFDWMYPGLKFEDATYEDQMRADEKEAEWEMLGKEGIEEKLKYFKKDKNGDLEAKNIKIDDPEEQRNKIAKSGNFDEVFTPTDRVLEWKTPQGQKGRIDSKADPNKFKKIMEKINNGTTKTKVTLRDVTQEARALEKQRAMEEAEKERKKKEKAEAMAKKKQDEYKKLVRMKAFQRLIDMQWFERYPFLTEDEIKKRYGFTDQEWKDITEQNEIKLPKKRGEKARSDFNKAVDSQVKTLIEGLGWQNSIKRKDAEKDLGEIGEIDLDVLLGRDEEKGAKEVEEFEKIAEEKQPEDKNKKAQELTNKWKTDVQEMFRKAEEKRNERYANKEEKEIDEVKTVDEAKKLTKGSRWKRVKDFWKDTTIQDLIQPISSRIEKISPRIYLELMRFEQRISIKENVRMKQVEDFVKKMAKIRSKNKKDYLNITLHLLNGNVGTANQMLEKYGTSIPRQLLDEIWADAEDVGYTMNYEGFYYPRKVKDVEAFLDRFVKTEEKSVQGEIDKIIRKKEKQAMERGEEFTAQQKADLINQLLMDGEVEGISLGSGHMKKRKVATITKDMLQFYEDPVDALLQYITSMTEAVEKARFLGQGKRGDIKSLGEFIADEGITGYDADELKKLLLSRFNYAPMGNMMSKLKVSANIIHLGSPSSALSQLADVSFSLIENGLVNLVQGLSRKYNIDLDALGITNRGEELRTQGKNETKWEKLQRFTFKWTGFNMMDQFGKKSFVVSTLNKLIKYAKKGDPQLRKDLERWFDDPKMIDQVIEDLKEGRMSENVNLFLFTKLADVQPLTRTQMTNTYLRAGNWRVLYAFKTFGIKQLDYIIQRGKRELATKPTAKALRSIATMLGIIMLCGASDDELKDFSMGRKYSSWIWRMIEGNDRSASQLSDRFWDNFLKLLGFTKYSIYQARTQGIKSAIEDIFFSLPGLDLFTYPMQDIQDAMGEDGLDFSQASSWQLIPIIGKYGYRWVGAGQTKQQKSLGKEKKKKKKGSGSGGVRSRV